MIRLRMLYKGLKANSTNFVNKMKTYLYAILFNLFVSISGQHRADTIYSNLSSRTPYRFNANTNVTDVSEEESECTEKIWMIIRHGTRNPGKTDINNMNSRLPEIKNLVLDANTNENAILNNNELELFEDWLPTVDVADKKKLVAEGEMENYEMSQRMQTRYPNALPAHFDNDTYLIKFTDSQRTRESAKYFAMGLFGEENLEDVYFPEPTDDDLLILRFYKLCSKWQNEVKDNPEALIEKTLFEATDIVQQAVQKVNQAIGLTDQLSLADVQLMYKTCGFETAWSRTSTSPWCIPFDLDTIKVFEYIEDLDYYWTDGYGYEITYKQACLTFGDMIRFFDDDQNERKAILYFTHSGTLLKFMAHLGLFNDGKPLLHSDFEENSEENSQDSNRYWKTSQIDNFATNVAFILHNCGGSKSILVRQNEHIVRLPACPSSDLCDFEIVKSYYDESINSCNFDEMCENVQ